MRITWLVLGVVVAAGAVAFVNTDDPAPDLPPAGVSKSPLDRRKVAQDPPAADLDLSEAQLEAENLARALLERMRSVQTEGGDTAPLVDRLRRTAWDTPSARRYAYDQGRERLKSTGPGRRRTDIVEKDRLRRLLSRALFLPEMFQAGGAPTAERTKLVATLQALNREVMTYGPGLEGVTRPYEVPEGLVPVQIVSRQKLMCGSNAILYWNQGGNLDPRRLRAGQTILLPLEELTLQVSLRHRRLAIFFADWFVKDFRVGIGKDETPTPTGVFSILSRQLNPDWYPPGGGKKIPFGHPNNELGSAWMAIANDTWPRSASFGIHGTKDPSTVGQRCSNGCVRLTNPHVVELRDWVRTASAGGKATQVIVR